MDELSQATSILLIEDHDLFRMGLRTALQAQREIEVVGEADNAAQGLALIEKCRPDVAIVDIGLPDMDGIELTRKFRQSATSPATKILILTMHENEDSVLAAFAAGADSYCMKHVQIEQLAEAIHATHLGNAWIDPAIASIVLKQMRSSEPAATGTIAIKSIEPEYGQLLESYPLTERELEILELIVSGCSNADIAERLYITVGTVKTHVRNVLNKLCADDRTQAAVRALRSGLVV
jgi:two-component system, NarL family, response regulator LiaR